MQKLASLPLSSCLRAPAACLLFSLASAALAACGDDASGSGGAAGSAASAGSSGSAGAQPTAGGTGVAGASGSGAAGGSGGASGGAGVSGGAGSAGAPVAGGWQKAFKDSAKLSCGSTYEQVVASDAPRLKFGSTEIFIGYIQLDQNQDPVVRRFDGGAEKYCVSHETKSPDGRAHGLTWDGGARAYVVYTIVGGGSELDQAAKGFWISSYGDGGASAKVAVLGEFEVETGQLQRAVFIPAKLNDGKKTNSLVPADAVSVLADGTLEFLGNSAFSPLNPDRTPMCLGGTEYPSHLDPADDKSPSFLGRFSADLTTLLCASTLGCSQVKSPCP